MAVQVARMLELEEVGQVIVARLRTDSILDESNLKAFDREVTRGLQSHNPPRLLLNFSGVEHLSSAVIGTLFRLSRRVQSAGGRLALCQLGPVLAEIFEITGARRMFNVYSGEQDGLLSF